MVTLISLHDKCVHLPMAEEKESARAWVYALSGVTGTLWWMEPNFCYSSGLAFMAMPGLIRIEGTHWTARCVITFLYAVAI